MEVGTKTQFLESSFADLTQVGVVSDVLIQSQFQLAVVSQFEVQFDQKFLNQICLVLESFVDIDLLDL